MSYARGLGFTPTSSGDFPTVTMDPGDELPTVHLGLTYYPIDPEPTGPGAVNLGLWAALLVATYMLAGRVGGRI